MNFARFALICCSLLLHASLCLAADLNSDLFDAPAREQHLTLPPNPSDPNPDAHPEVSCYYYPGFMVKEVDLVDVKGADQLSIIFIQKDTPEPVCRRENVKDERVIEDWSGYFAGARQGYVFFGGDDLVNGGAAFAVYDTADDRMLFSDVAHPMLSIEPMLPPRDPELRPWYYSPLRLKYHKVYVASCSMGSDAPRCWALIQQATGLNQAAAPNCEAAYAKEEQAAPLDQRAGLREDPSVIVYAVETVIDGQGVTRVTPQAPVLDCYPAP